MEFEAFVSLIGSCHKNLLFQMDLGNVCLGRHEWKLRRNRQRITLIPTALNFNTGRNLKISGFPFSSLFLL